MGKKQKAIDAATDFLRMYKLGFLDGVLSTKKAAQDERKVWEKIKQKCLKSFEFRFVPELQGKIKLKGGK